MPGTYDPELNTLYWGTGNPAPDYDGSIRPGDDLYTSCLLALNPDTGTLKWYFQFSPHDLYDYDAVQTPVLVNAALKDQPRKLMVTANRNGFLYILDRTNGKFLYGKSFVDTQNWAEGLDENGRPISAGLIPDEKGVRVCPANGGGTNWYSSSYNSATHMFYFRSFEACAVLQSHPRPFVEGRAYYATGMETLGETGKGYINALILIRWISPGGMSSTEGTRVGVASCPRPQAWSRLETTPRISWLRMGAPASLYGTSMWGNWSTHLP